MKSHDILLGAYWFLNSLFWGGMIFYYTIKYFKSKFLGFMIIITLSICLFSIPNYLPFSSRNFLAASFIYIGYIIRLRNIDFYLNRTCAIIIIFFIAVLSMFWNTSMTRIESIDILPYCIIATLCSFSLLKICDMISDISVLGKLLLFIGCITFSILTWHFLVFKIGSIVLVGIYELDWIHLSDFPVIKEYAETGWYLLYAFLGVCIPSVTYHTFNKLRK